MDDNRQAKGDPEERAFTGHPDHPPAESDQPAEENQELLRGEPEGGEGAGQSGGEGAPKEGGTGGDEQWTSLPGYG